MLVVALAAFLHASALRAPFVGQDFWLLDAVSSRSMPGAVLAPDPVGDAFRPVGRQLYFSLLTHVGGGSPGVAHGVNLALFLISLLMLAWVAKRIAGSYAAAITVALVGLSYAADVPVLWASGGQDLIALTAALGSIVLYMAGARPVAGVLLFLGLLSNESILLVPLVAIVAARKPREFFADSIRNAWPMFAAVGGWAVLWLAELTRHAFTLKLPAFHANAAPASVAHLFQILLGLEWDARRGPRLHVEWYGMLIVALAALCVAWAGAHRRQSRGPTSSRADRTGANGAWVGIVWALAGTLPLIAIMPTWSAHQYLFALCGLALLVGSWAARQMRWLGPSLIVLLGLCSQNTHGLDSAATTPSAWNTVSHVNRYSLLQDMRPVAHYVEELKRVRSDLPHKSTVFFAGLPSFWETGGGRLLRSAYHDSTLRAYDLSVFSLERARRGPAVFFGFERDSVRELSPAQLRDFAVSSYRSRRNDAAHDALVYASETRPDDWLTRYWLAWIELSRGDTSAALGHLERLGMRERSGEPFKWDGSWAQKALAAGDTSQSIALLKRTVHRQALEPEPHRRLSQLVRAQSDADTLADVEAYAARVLAARTRPPD